MRRTFAVIIGVLAAAPAAAASAPVQHLDSHVAGPAPLVQTCHLNRQQLTLCDIRSASAKLAQRDSFDGTYSVGRCQTASRGCYASDSLDPRKLSDFGLTITGDTGRMIWTGLTSVTQQHGRICARWAMIYGSACV